MVFIQVESRRRPGPPWATISIVVLSVLAFFWLAATSGDERLALLARWGTVPAQLFDTSAPLIRLRTSTVTEPPRCPRATSRNTSSPTTAMSCEGRPSRASSSRTAARDGLPTTSGRAPVAFAIAAVSIAPRLKIGPSAPAYAGT